ncbi:MAG: hypothetical protein COU10_00740 [Candidatus Harrisonbacteria bacterium CG10_big_fil_rev_8_21_14_0_10_45_28]|uniref:ECF transporter S component n=1 Tax=Candidatus Harrisonbacteria bacterium CG10_big_fil_rev_8_21_14_0_10_45_28 TaxID=1974586 RepID=A0A2H0UR63_9BACT|nr:MAG: hypothetical protein COU10_00740 [Candidatus Harrisonbacteria bacterium CG10_big_fil_rev_8_21_14_0_10_45_28]
MNKFLTKKNLYFTAIFTVLGFLALQVPVAQIVGAKGNFTLFDFFGPLAASFIGLVPGLIAIFLTQLANVLVHNTSFFEAAVLIRFFPMLFAAFYFASKSRFTLIIPIAAMVGFLIHPIGASAWLYSTFWLIPIIAYFFKDQSLFLRSLGTTFTAHAVGGVLWLYTFGLSSETWLALIPVVAKERLMFGVGIMVSYLVFNNVLAFLTEKKLVRLPFLTDKKYLLGLPK